MTAAMRAAFTLTLDDKLSSGLNTIKKAFDELRNKGQELTLGKLERGGDALRKVSEDVRKLTSDLRGIEQSADRAGGSLRKMASVRVEALKNWGQHTLGPQSRMGAFAAAAEGYSIYGPSRLNAKYKDDIIHIGITKNLSGDALKEETARLGKKLNAEALETGQSSQSTVEAYGNLVKLGIDPHLVEESILAHSLAATAYKTTSEAFTGSTAAMLQNFGVRPDQLPQALSALGQASKEGGFKVTDFSMYLPGVGAQFKKNGMTGLSGANLAMAALQTTMKDVHQPGQAATDAIQGLLYIFSGAGARAFGMENMHKGEYTTDIQKLVKRALGNEKTGININRLLQNAEKQGIDPIHAIVPKLLKMTKGFSNSERSELFGALFHNVSAGNFWGALVSHFPFFDALEKKLNSTPPEQLGRDTASAMSSPEVTLRKGEESLTQLGKRVGEGFEPVVETIVKGLEGMVHGVNGIDEKLPGFNDAVLKVTGGLLAVGTGLAGIGLIAPAITAGAALIGGAAAGFWGTAAIALGWALKKGSDHETPENREAVERRKREMRLPDGGPNGRLFDGFGPDGRPLGADAPVLPNNQYLKPQSLELPPAPPSLSPGAKADSPVKVEYLKVGTLELPPAAPPPPPEPVKLDITVRTDPGTAVTVEGAPPGSSVNTAPNAGPTTNRP